MLLGLFLHLPPAFATEQEAQLRPLWEIGVVGAGGWGPDYPASDENHFVGIGLPYVRYRGKIFRAGGASIVRGRFLRSERFELDVSLNGSFPADSDKNDARRGMPDLDALFEIGPRLRWTVAKPSPQSQLQAEFPVRVVFSLALDDVAYRGFVFQPRLAYQHDNVFGVITRARITAGPVFTTEKLMDYFYEVKPRFATPSRPAFDADAGYLGMRFGISLRRTIGRVNLFTGARIGYYEGATNADSPLFRSKVTVGIGFGFAWSFYHSKRREVL